MPQREALPLLQTRGYMFLRPAAAGRKERKEKSFCGSPFGGFVEFTGRNQRAALRVSEQKTDFAASS